MTNMVQEFKLESRLHRWWRIRHMWPDSMPVDKTWQIALPAAGFAAACAVLFVRWWLCL